jgi:GNAT superfamily N-acetyltransferase
VIRRGTPDDAAAVGEVFVRARDLMTYLPRIPDDDRPRLGGWLVTRHEIWVAEEGGEIAGFAGLSPGWLDHLYVGPERQGRGLGAALLQHAMALQRDGLQLWVFQQNAGARRFYERHGFRLAELTGGTANVEQQPDARYEWVPEERTGSSRS